MNALREAFRRLVLWLRPQKKLYRVVHQPLGDAPPREMFVDEAQFRQAVADAWARRIRS
jgi:hypothetical protein